MVAEERFRQDLYFRLADFRVHMPSLREREADIQVLAELFLQRRCELTGVPRSLGAEACGALRVYSWPGNVRELKSVVERAHIMADGDTIAVADLALTPEDTERRSSANDALLMLNHDDAIHAFERHYFTHLLTQHPTRAKAALAAGMTAEGLRLALRRLKLGHPLNR
jgi:DNA-binding NtrC family response regulator